MTAPDLASAEHPALPGKQALVARDAYNGVVLWRVMFSDWHPIYIRNKEMPVQIQRRLVAIGDIVYCTPGYSAPINQFDAATGDVLWRERLGGRYSASPVWAEDRIYFLSEKGETVVIRCGPEFEVIARNKLEEKCCASPAVSQANIFIRSENNLFCIGPKPR